MRYQECVLLGLGKRERKTKQITLSAGANSETLSIDFLSSGFHGKFIRRFITYQSSSASIKSKMLFFFSSFFLSSFFATMPIGTCIQLRRTLLIPLEVEY